MIRYFPSPLHNHHTGVQKGLQIKSQFGEEGGLSDNEGQKWILLALYMVYMYMLYIYADSGI